MKRRDPLDAPSPAFQNTQPTHLCQTRQVKFSRYDGVLSMSSANPIGYQHSGVNIDEADRAVASIRTMARRTFSPAVLTDIGSFGGGYLLKGYKEPVLVSSADGVGTKLKLAFMNGEHSTVGEDLVNQ